MKVDVTSGQKHFQGGFEPGMELQKYEPCRATCLKGVSSLWSLRATKVMDILEAREQINIMQPEGNKEILCSLRVNKEIVLEQFSESYFLENVSGRY